MPPIEQRGQSFFASFRSAFGGGEQRMGDGEQVGKGREQSRAGRVDLTPMLTHTFGLDDWRDAFAALADQEASGAIKVAFDFRP